MSLILGVFLITMLSIVLCLAIGIKSDSKSTKQTSSQSAQELSAINSLLREQHAVNHATNLQQVSVDVLDVYEQNGIRIQADILEDLSYNTFTTHKEVFNFIESQRNNWKAESTKKLPKGSY